MNILDIINKKRLNSSLSKSEIEYVVRAYLDDTINDLKGYASIQYRFAGMKKKDFDEFFTTIEEFDLLMIDKIYN